MTDAIAATLHSYKSLATRKQLQLTLEIPQEYAAAALKMLGVADSGESKWFAVTLLKNGPDMNADDEPANNARPHAEAKGQDKPRTLSNIAAVMVKENKDFQNWLVDIYWTGKEEIGDYDGLLKKALGIKSKTELDTDPEAAKRFQAMRTDFEYRHSIR